MRMVGIGSLNSVKDVQMDNVTLSDDDLLFHAHRIGITRDELKTRIRKLGVTEALQRRSPTAFVKMGKQHSPWGNGEFLLNGSKFGS